MNKFLHRIGLMGQVTIQSKVRKEVLIERLKDFMDIPFHIHKQKGKRLYQGEVSDTEFSFRRKKGFLGFDQDSETLVKVLGTIKEDNGQTIITAQIVGQARELLMTWTMVGVFFLTITILYNTVNFQWGTLFLLLGFLVFFLSHRYTKLRRGVSKMTRTADFELNNLARREKIPQHLV